MTSLQEVILPSFFEVQAQEYDRFYVQLFKMALAFFSAVFSSVQSISDNILA